MKHHLRRVPKIIGQPTEKLAPTVRDQQKADTGRGGAAEAGANNGKPHTKCLKESLQLQKQLRQLTHQVLMAQEDEREKISHELRDEIAQTLMGINVRLLLLKQAARSKAKGIKSEIASTQRLVLESAMLMRRLARELDDHLLTPTELIVTAI
jgi:signal transduction histidine kinase